KSSSIFPESGHRESFRGCVESGCLLNSPRKARNVRRSRGGAGLRARLRFGRTLLDEAGCERVMRSRAHQIGCPQSQGASEQATHGTADWRTQGAQSRPNFKTMRCLLAEVESHFNLYAAIHRLAA